MINSELNFTLEEVLPKFDVALQEKILHSVELIRKAEKLALAYDPENGYYNTFSGGKDSQCLYHIVKLAGVKHKTHMNLTSVDPPEVIRFVKTQYPDVDLIKPEKSIYQYAVDMKILPTMRVRWCCAKFKESAGAGKVTLIGIRHAESPRRAKRNEVEINNRKFSGNLDELDEYRKSRNAQKRGRKPKGYREVTIVNATGERTLGCIRGKESLLISPIINWTDDDVWTFLNTLGITHCELYDQGWHRIGCIGCPMSSAKQKILENERWPHVKRNWINAIKAIRNGGYSRKNISGGTSEPTGDCGGAIIGSPNPRYVINRKWLQQPDQFLRVPSRQQRSLRQRQGHARLQDCIGFSEGSSSDRLTDEQENEIAENIYDWWISGKGYQQWYNEKFRQQTLNF